MGADAEKGNNGQTEGLTGFLETVLVGLANGLAAYIARGHTVEQTTAQPTSPGPTDDPEFDAQLDAILQASGLFESQGGSSDSIDGDPQQPDEPETEGRVVEERPSPGLLRQRRALRG